MISAGHVSAFWEVIGILEASGFHRSKRTETLFSLETPTESLSRRSQQEHVARDPEESRIGESGFPEIRDSCMLDSRSAIYRQDLSRPSEGQVSEIKALSEFDASGNRSSRGHENQDIISPETPRINPGRPSARTGGKG